MNIHFDNKGSDYEKAVLKVVSAYQGKDKKDAAVISHWKNKELKSLFSELKTTKEYKGSKNSVYTLHHSDQTTYRVIGLGQKKNVNKEVIRRVIANVTKSLRGNHSKFAINLDDFGGSKNLDALLEGIYLADYDYTKYKSNPENSKIKDIIVFSKDKGFAVKAKKINDGTSGLCESINFARDLINDPPNSLDSETYAKLIESDVKSSLKGKGIKVKILDKAAIKKEKMNLFLSVNAGSAKQPRLVHLSYKPKKVSKNTKHIALVGKGITFDTGGYSLKPGNAMMGMKFDMGGSATVYGAFRAAVLADSPNIITCIIPMTDNAVKDTATMPDSIIKGRNGKTVEILNTDAEGRLILADALDYAGDLKPNVIIDAATLTGACLVALGDEVCGLMSNSPKLVAKLKKSAKNVDEYLWELPIVDEFREQMKSKIADLKNIGKPMRAGTATAGAFLEEFIQEGINWAHFDVAGVAGDQAHLPYCPTKGGSGIIIRTMVDFLVTKQ